MRVTEEDGDCGLGTDSPGRCRQEGHATQGQTPGTDAALARSQNHPSTTWMCGLKAGVYTS